MVVARARTLFLWFVAGMIFESVLSVNRLGLD